MLCLIACGLHGDMSHRIHRIELKVNDFAELV